jgi:hypothetical protein
VNRHDRNAKLLQEHGVKRTTFDGHIQLSIDPGLAPTADGQTSFIALANLVARFSDAVTITAPDVLLREWAPWGTSTTLAGRAAEIVHGIGAKATASGPVIARIHVGLTRPTDAPPQTILIGNDGWIGFASIREALPNISASTNPAGALAAAGLGAGLAFRLLIMHAGGTAPDSDDEIRLNVLQPGSVANPAWRPTTLPEDILISGGGAVAHGLVYALRACAVKGQGIVVDGQDFKVTGANRYLLAPSNAMGPKAHIVAAQGSRDGFALQSVALDYGPWRDQATTIPPIAVSTVDNRDWNRARKDLQTDLPRNLIHAATGQATFSVANIDFLDGPCLGCLVPEAAANENIAQQLAAALEIPTEEAFNLFFGGQALQRHHLTRFAKAAGKPEAAFLALEGKPGTSLWGDDLCSIMAIPTPNGTIHGTCSHITLLAGLLASVELMKLGNPDLAQYRETCMVRIPVYLPGQPDRTVNKNPHRCSIDCTDPVLQQEWKTKWRSHHDP